MNLVCIIDEERINVDLEDIIFSNGIKHRSFSPEKEMEDEVTKFITKHN